MPAKRPALIVSIVIDNAPASSPSAAGVETVHPSPVFSGATVNMAGSPGLTSGGLPLRTEPSPSPLPPPPQPAESRASAPKTAARKACMSTPGDQTTVLVAGQPPNPSKDFPREGTLTFR